MNRLLLFALICLMIACTTTKPISGKPGTLDGVWVPVKQEMGGEALPLPAFEKDTLTLQDTTYKYSDRDKGVAIYNDGHMDIYGREGVNAGKHFTAIYKVDHGQLIVCYNLAADGYPADFETKSKPSLFMSVFKRSSYEEY
jgi:uncharacterized protein (TIGR03067 family)